MTFMPRLRHGAVLHALALSVLAAGLWISGGMGLAWASASRVEELANAITELDVARARELVKSVHTESPGLAFQRARLAVYVGDCDSAEAVLGGIPPTADTQRLAELARTCARATAGSAVFEDESQGVWIRFQDSNDQALAPLLVEVAVQARETMKRDLGVELPRPLRIDLVRDLFSLASVSGLPVDAAETTGTVAVARWGRVTMLTPRAARHGYPWQDTLAHEITHLALSRGSRDFAPLWLQEGVAKREETRWRQARPFDDEENPDAIARRALLDGTSVGIDRIGPSIAMLPTPAAARISYAEVQSFMNYWIDVNGKAAFTLLMLDLKGLATREIDEVMDSVTGYPLRYWIARWQHQLLGPAQPNEPAQPQIPDLAPDSASRPAVQLVRLGDLVRRVDGAETAFGYYVDAAAGTATDRPAVRYRAAAAAWALGNADEVPAQLGELGDLKGLHGSWLGLRGRVDRAHGDLAGAEQAFSLAVAVDPFGTAAACEGVSAETELRGPLLDKEAQNGVRAMPLPTHTVRRELCRQARAIPRD